MVNMSKPDVAGTKIDPSAAQSEELVPLATRDDESRSTPIVPEPRVRLRI